MTPADLRRKEEEAGSQAGREGARGGRGLESVESLRAGAMPHSPASARGLCLRPFCSTLFGFQVKNSLLRGYGFQLGFTRIMDAMENSLGSAKGRRGQAGQGSANGNTTDAN